MKKTKKSAKPKVSKNAAPSVSGTKVPKIGKEVLFRKNTDGTIAIMRLDNDEYFFTLNGIAAEVWLMIDGKSSFDVIKEKLRRKHNPPESRFEKDVMKLVLDLKKEKLIHA